MNSDESQKDQEKTSELNNSVESQFTEEVEIKESVEFQPPSEEEPEQVTEASDNRESFEEDLFAEELFDEPTSNENQEEIALSAIAQLKQQKQELERDLQSLSETKNQLSQQIRDLQTALGETIAESLKDLEERRSALLISIEQLERRRERIAEEMRTSFAGVSQDLAIRIQGFKEYLVGSLQDLAATAEQLELPSPQTWERAREAPPEPAEETTPKPQFAQQGFEQQTTRIQKLLEQYRIRPDYYGPPWQLRRTFEPIHAERVQSWFFTKGGRGALRTMGSRLQNILVASTIISVLHTLYGDHCRTLVLADTPERLGEWRRGLQDCLGISRTDFGPNRGVVLFEAPEALVQKAERLVQQKQLPLVIIDETEERISLGLLEFPLWLAFAPDPQQMSSYMY